MTEEPRENDSLPSLIAVIMDADARGEAVNRDEILRNHPEHEQSLREFFANHDAMKDGENLGEESSLPPASTATEDVTLPPTNPCGDEATLPKAGEQDTSESKVGERIRYFGDYELLEEIARGGMGVVYKARQINLNRVVALKMILSGQLASEEDVKRFYTEAEAAANLDHPGIVPIFEIGEHEGQHYFSMGYIEGQSLAKKVADGPLPPRESAELVKKICEAMAYAHERGVIHRDLKPANILIDQDGQPKVTDFGLAKRMEADSNLTGTGQILGTPSYMAPEQASGKVEEVGPLADVYALGAILYCLLTGRPPFHAASPMDTLLQVLEKDAIPLRLLNAALPKDLETICLKCLDKDARKRYPDAKALRDELGRFSKGEPIVARPVKAHEKLFKWVRRKPEIAALSTSVVVLFILGFAGVTWQWREALAAKEQQTLQTKKAENALYLNRISFANRELEHGRVIQAATILEECLERLRGWEWRYLSGLCKTRHSVISVLPESKQIRSLSFSDGHDIVVTGAEGKVFRCDMAQRTKALVATIDGLAGVPHSTSGGLVAAVSRQGVATVWHSQRNEEVLSINAQPFSCAAISPNGETFAVTSDGKLKFWDISDGSQTGEIDCKFGPGTKLVFAPDSEFVAAAIGEFINVWNVPNQTTTLQLKIRQTGREQISISSDNKFIATASGVDQSTYLWSLESGELVDVLHGDRGHQIRSLAFSPDGQHILSANGPVVILWDLESKRRVLELPIEKSSSFEQRIAFSKDGTRFAVCAADLLHVCNIPRKQPKVLSREFERTYAGIPRVAVTSDGKRLAWGQSWKSGATTNTVLQLVDIGTGLPTKDIDAPPFSVRSLGFGENGNLMIFSANTDGSSEDAKGEIGIVDAVTGEKRLSITTLNVVSAALSPKGDLVAYADSNFLHLADSSTGEPKWSSPFTERVLGSPSHVVFSPDGEQIATREGLWSVSKGTKNLELPLSLASAFDTSGKLIASYRGDSIEIRDAMTGELVKTVDVSGVQDMTFSPDGKRLLVSVQSRIGERRNGHLQNSVRLIDTQNGNDVFLLRQGTFLQSGFAFDPTGAAILLAGNSWNEYFLEIWDTGEQIPDSHFQR